jgi:hypothetical protein
VSEVEFLTIDLYLTGVYSFTSLSLESGSTYDMRQKEICAAVQEISWKRGIQGAIPAARGGAPILVAIHGSGAQTNASSNAA